jgi:ribosome recycling factor
MDAAVEDARRRLAALRGGRASIDMIADVRVSAWGSDLPLSQVAQLGMQPPRGLVVTPHDPSLLPAIERALGDGDLGARPRVDGVRVRLELPAPTDERRVQLARQAKDAAEQGRVAVRLARRDAVNELRRLRAADEVSEAKVNGRSRDLQAQCDEHVARIDELLELALAAIAE